MKKNTNLKKNLVKKSVLPAAFAVLGSAIALTSVSYAWFTQGDAATINGIDVNIQSAEGLQFHTGAADFKMGSLITGAQLREPSLNNKLPEGNILPVSSDGVHADGEMNMFLGTSSNKQGVAKLTSTNDTDNFVKFDFYVQVDTQQDLMLTDESSVTFAQGSTDKGIQNCVRVAFINMGHGEKLDDTLKQAHPTGGTPTPVIWEPNAAVHSTKVVNYYASLGKTITQVPYDYSAFNTTFGETAVDSLSGQLTSMKGKTHTTPLANGALKITTVEPGFNKVRCYIWVEGQDIDCINAASASKFSVSLGFKRQAVIQ